MMHLRLSVTDLDAYRYFREHEDADLAAFLAQMRRKGEQTEAMKAGSAFHLALEHAKDGTHATLEAEGYTFELAPEVELAIPAIREIKATKLYRIDGADVTLVGKVDAISGRVIYDHKLTGRFDPERFLGGYQWRAYLDIFGADAFVWNVFEGRAVEGDGPSDKQDAPDPGIRYRINQVHDLRAYRYPGLARDLLREIEGFVDMAKVHLPERFDAEAA